MDSYEIYALLEDYFTQMYEMCRRGGFDVLGHLTYPLRYICGEYGIQIDLRRFDDIIAQIFRTLIGGGMGIEINTSGLRQKYGRALPDLGFVKLYREPWRRDYNPRLRRALLRRPRQGHSAGRGNSSAGGI